MPGHSRVLLAAALAAFPWLHPLAGGPSASVQPWLVAMACALALWLLAAPAGVRVHRGLLAAAAALVLWAALWHLPVRPEVAMLAGGLLLIVLAAAVARDPEITDGIQAGVLFAAGASAVIALCQYFGLAERLAPLVSFARAGEAYGNLRQPNQFASLCWIGGAVLLWGAPRLPRGGAIALMVLLAVGSAASVSRTALLQGFALTALAALWGGPQRRWRLSLCIAAALAYLAAVWALPFLLEAVRGDLPERTLWGRLQAGEACNTRTVLWANVLHLIALKPLAGWGWGELDYAHYLTLYSGPRFCDILDNAHDLPLHLAVELGVPVAVAVCAGGIAWAWRQRPWREQAPLRQLAWAWLAVMLLHSLLEYPLWYGPFQIAFGAALCWLLTGADASRAAGVHRPTAALAGVLLAATAYAAWDYARVSQIYLPPDERRADWRDETLVHVRRSWLFSGQAGFADLTLATVTRANAERMYVLAQEMLHYSPEPRVIERMIESATMLGRTDEAVLHLARYRAAFPKDYEAWRAQQARP